MISLDNFETIQKRDSFEIFFFFCRIVFSDQFIFDVDFIHTAIQIIHSFFFGIKNAIMCQ